MEDDRDLNEFLAGVGRRSEDDSEPVAQGGDEDRAPVKPQRTTSALVRHTLFSQRDADDGAPDANPDIQERGAAFDEPESAIFAGGTSDAARSGETTEVSAADNTHPEDPEDDEFAYAIEETSSERVIVAPVFTREDQASRTDSIEGPDQGKGETAPHSVEDAEAASAEAKQVVKVDPFGTGAQTPGEGNLASAGGEETPSGPTIAEAGASEERPSGSETALAEDAEGRETLAARHVGKTPAAEAGSEIHAARDVDGEQASKEDSEALAADRDETRDAADPGSGANTPATHDAAGETTDEPDPARLRSPGMSLRRKEVAPDAATAEEHRKPRVVLMGEFSAGKSTLMNLLLGEPALPVNATATRLPPIWITKGDTPGAVRVDLDGHEESVDITATDIPVEDTHHIRLEKSADLLDICDLIDTPGISDPNMSAHVWQRMIEHADVVIWCTHATQAWRQSEAAAWDMMPEKLRARSILLLTRFDKIADGKDRMRVLKRVSRETDGLFRDVFPIALIDAIAAGDDKDAFAAAGGTKFADALFEVIGLIQRRHVSVRTRPRSQTAPFKLEPEPETKRTVVPRRVRPRPLAARPPSSRGAGVFGQGGEPH